MRREPNAGQVNARGAADLDDATRRKFLWRLGIIAGCVDIDLGWSPSTNTIPIRRLNLRVGARSGPLTMAWVRFPDLTLGPLGQDYECLEERRYRYTSRGGGFRAIIEVDDEGLVVEYEGLSQRARETR
jgi:hypothetical protein